MVWDDEVLPMMLPMFSNREQCYHPLMDLIKWRALSEEAARAIFRNAKTYFASLVASHSGSNAGIITECALVLLAEKLSFSYRPSAKVLPVWRFIRSRVVRESGFHGRSPYSVEENDLVEFALQHSRLAEVFSADERFSMFSDFITRRQKYYHGSFKRSVKLKEWKNGVGDEFKRMLASIREKTEEICSTGIDDCSAILPFFAGRAEFDAFKVMYEKSTLLSLRTEIDALAADISVLDGSMEQLSKSGFMRDNRFHHVAKIEIGNMVKYDFSIEVTDIGAGVKALEAGVKALEEAKFTPFWLFLLAIPVLIVSAIIQANFHPTGTFGDIVIYSGGIAAAYILIVFFICAAK